VYGIGCAGAAVLLACGTREMRASTIYEPKNHGGWRITQGTECARSSYAFFTECISFEEEDGWMISIHQNGQPNTRNNRHSTGIGLVYSDPALRCTYYCRLPLYLPYNTSNYGLHKGKVPYLRQGSHAPSDLLPHVNNVS
jgi:hypothetical protein